MSARTKLGKSMRKKYVRGSHRDLTYVGVLLFALLVDDAIVLAEGNSFGGSFGVNRRVVSTPGFVKVSGNFSVKDFVLPKGSEGQYVSPAARPAGHNTQIQVNSKPTFYLGAQASGLPAESGYQFEWEPCQVPPALVHLFSPKVVHMFSAKAVHLIGGQWRRMWPVPGSLLV